MEFFIAFFNIVGYVIAVYYNNQSGFYIRIIGGLMSSFYFINNPWILMLTLFYVITDVLILLKKNKYASIRKNIKDKIKIMRLKLW